jgi:hypothetical protein
MGKSSDTPPDQKIIDSLIAWMDGEENAKQESLHKRKDFNCPYSPQVILDKLFSEKENGDKWRRLYEGDFEYYYPSVSEAVAALLLKLAFYAQKDEDLMEEIIRSSGLYSTKFEERRGSTTWIKSEVSKSAKKTTDVYTPKGKNTLHSHSHSLSTNGSGSEHDSDSILDLIRSNQAVSFRGRAKPNSRAWVVDKMLPRKYAGCWFGAGGTAKSLLAVHMGMAVATPEHTEWLGFPIVTTPVLVVDFELDIDEHHRRVLQLCEDLSLSEEPEHLYYLGVAEMPPAAAFVLAAHERERVGAGLVIVDSVGFAMEGDSEGSKDVLAWHRERIRPLLKGSSSTAASVLLVDHQSKVIKGEKYADKTEFGSVYKSNSVRASFQIRGAWEEGTMTATLTHKKHNFTELLDDFSVCMNFSSEYNGSIAVNRLDEALPDPDREPTAEEKVLAAIKEKGNATFKEAATIAEVPEKTAENLVSGLVKDGKLVDTGEKRDRTRVVSLTPASQPYYGSGSGSEEEITPESATEEVVPEGVVEPPEYAYITDDEGLEETIAWVTGSKSPVIALDLETVGTNPRALGSRIRLVQVSNGERTAVVDAFEMDTKPLLEEVIKHTWVAHNAVFEASWLREHMGLDASDPNKVRDTYILSRVLDAGVTETKFRKKDGAPYEAELEFGLGETAKRELGVILDKEMQTSDWDAPTLSKRQLDYAATDAHVLGALYEKLTDRFRKEYLR